MGQEQDGRCPVDHGKPRTIGESSTSSSLWGLFGTSSKNPVSAKPPEPGPGAVVTRGGAASESGGCPVDHGKITNKHLVTTTKETSFFGSWFAPSSRPVNAIDDRVVASLEEAAKHAQSPQPGQILPLSTHRATSSIPRGGILATETPLPHHQPKTGGPASSSESCTSTNLAQADTSTSSQLPQKWVYPSEQQVFNAMKRKGWEGIEETSIPSFLQIHNSVNERSWRQLCEWERGTAAPNDITLVRFQGRPKTMSPKAWMLSTFGLSPEPFDRHDWYIDNGIDHEKRYVLDFYMYDREHSASNSNINKSMIMPRVEIDVRPALDSPQAAVARLQRVASDCFPGIATALQQATSSPQPAPSTMDSNRKRPNTPRD
jgi:cytochrome c heme-lyase